VPAKLKQAIWRFSRSALSRDLRRTLAPALGGAAGAYCLRLLIHLLSVSPTAAADAARLQPIAEDAVLRRERRRGNATRSSLHGVGVDLVGGIVRSDHVVAKLEREARLVEIEQFARDLPPFAPPTVGVDKAARSRGASSSSTVAS
jgi:hypothetical protein